MSTNAYKYVCKTKDSKKAGINGSYGSNSRLQKIQIQASQRFQIYYY